MHSLVQILQVMQRLSCKKNPLVCVEKQNDPARTLLNNTTDHAGTGLARNTLVYRSAERHLEKLIGSPLQ